MIEHDPERTGAESVLAVYHDPLYAKAVALPRATLDRLAHDMPYRAKSKRFQLAYWLVRFYPERVQAEPAEVQA
jgi:hypothetical protein